MFHNLQLLLEFTKWLKVKPLELIWDKQIGMGNENFPQLLIPLNKRVAKEVFGYPPAVVSYHVTNIEGFESLRKIQKKSNVIYA